MIVFPEIFCHMQIPIEFFSNRFIECILLLGVYSPDKLTRLSTVFPILHILAGGHDWQ